MEPGLRDREYDLRDQLSYLSEWLLQWSPVLETGNTGQRPGMGEQFSDCCNGARS